MGKSLIILNPPICIHCGGKECRRIGYDPAKSGSLWKCWNVECGKTFLVPTLMLKKIDA